MAEFNPHELETITSNFGEIVEVPVSVPRYFTYHTSIVATGKQGSAPGELYSPSGVAIHEDTHQIFIVDSINHRVEIFSETGEFLNQLDVEWQSIIFGIATHGDSVYIRTNPRGRQATLPHHLWRRHECGTPSLLLFGSSQQLCHQRSLVSLNSPQKAISYTR